MPPDGSQMPGVQKSRITDVAKVLTLDKMLTWSNVSNDKLYLKIMCIPCQGMVFAPVPSVKIHAQRQT
jgi:hypothetical protein